MTFPANNSPEIEPHVPSPQMMAQEIGAAIAWSVLRMVGFGLIVMGLYWFGASMIDHLYTPDLPWLFAGGEAIIARRALSAGDIFSWTHDGSPWMLYQWLFEVLIVGLRHLLGEQMLLKLTALGIFGLYVALPYIRDKRRGIPGLLTLLVCLLSLLVAAINLSLRPMLVTCVGLAVQFLAVQQLRQGKVGTRSVFAMLAGLYCLWGNMHTGVTLGLLSLGLMALGDLLERREAYVFTPANPTLEGQPLRFRVYLGLLSVSFAASLLNPYGLGIYPYLANLSSQTFLNDAIVELMSPNFHLFGYRYLAGLFALFLLLCSRMRRVFSAQDVLLLLVFTGLTLFAQRFVVWLCLYYVLILPKALAHYWLDLGETYPACRDEVRRFARFEPTLIAGTVLAALAFLFYPHPALTVDTGFCREVAPGITAYHGLKRPTDRLYNEPEVGSCLLRQYADTPVFIDTRFDFYGTDFSRGVYQASRLEGDWEAFFTRWRINTWLIRLPSPLYTVLEARPDIKTLYKDRYIAVVRRIEPSRSNFKAGSTSGASAE